LLQQPLRLSWYELHPSVFQPLRFKMAEHDNAAAAFEDLDRPIYSHKDPRRMELSQQERDLAIKIKNAIARTKDMEQVSDFMCAQLALIDGDNAEVTLCRVHHLQCLKEEYRILDTLQDGKRFLVEYIDLFPNLFLCLSYCKESGQYILIGDNTKVDSSRLNSEERIHSCMGGAYYMCQMLCPDFEAIRCGTSLVFENEGYVWKSDMKLLKELKRLWTEVLSEYPLAVRRIKYFHTGMAMNILVAMAKSMLPESLRRNVETGCSAGCRLDTLYLVPTLEAANQRLLSRMAETLQRRYDNEHVFRL
jgi:hypothetical protein